MKREVDLVVLSDIHLGSYGCHASALNRYLKSIQPQTLVLNGDIVDIWNFRKSYFPAEHLEVVSSIMKMAADGVKVYYITGNHDDKLRSFGEISLGNIHLRNKLVLQVDGLTYWIFHGEVFDRSIQSARRLARLGSKGYDLLVYLNRSVNAVRNWWGLRPASFSARIKKSVKSAVRYIGDFEQAAIDMAAEKGYNCVICGHIHQPQMRRVTAANGQTVTYMNSGDWVEHLSALECHKGNWNLFHYHSLDFELENPKLKVPAPRLKTQVLSPEELLAAVG